MTATQQPNPKQRVNDRRASAQTSTSSPVRPEGESPLIVRTPGSRNITITGSKHIASAERIWAAHPELTPTSEVLDRLRSVVAKWHEIDQQRAELHPNQLKGRLREARTKLMDDPSRENAEAVAKLNVKVSAARGSTRDRIMLRAAGDKLLERLFAPTALDILEARVAVVCAAADELETEERKTAEFFGVPFEASETLRAVHGLIVRLNGIRAQIETMMHPGSILAALGVAL